MRLSRRTLVVCAAAAAAVVAGGLILAARGRGGGASFPPPPPGAVPEMEVAEGGVVYRLYAGRVYRVAGGELVPFKELYDPDFFAKNYVVENGKVSRRGDDGRLWPVGRSFESGFEGAADLRALIGPKCGWTSLTLQSPSARTVPDYVALRRRLLAGEGDFLDNRVEVVRGAAHGGEAALRCRSVPPARGMVCSKASISTEFIHFVRGDDFWFSAWYRIEEGRPFTLMDLETTWVDEHPGIRICLDEGLCPYFELKWADKPKYRQAGAQKVAMPVGRWAHLEAHFRLSEKDDGVAQLWLDGRQLLDARGRTLPLAGSVYNSLEVGISAHLDAAPAVVLVDDLRVSGQREAAGGAEP